MLTDSRYHLLSLLCCALTLTGFGAGCSQTPKEVATNNQEDTTAVQASKPATPIEVTETSIAQELLAEDVAITQPWKIAFIEKTSDRQNNFWKQAIDGAEQAGKDLGIEVQLISTTDPDQEPESVEGQILRVLQAIEQGDIDGIVIAPIEAVRMVPVIEKAIAAGIPVIAMNSPINTDQVLSYVTFDNMTAAQTIGEWVVNELGGKGKALILTGPLEHQVAIERRDGFLAGLVTGDIEVLATGSANWELEESEALARSWLAQFPEVDVILAANTRMAMGVANAVVASGREDILITGHDVLDGTVEAIAAGKITLTVDQSVNTQAALAVKMLTLHLEDGRTFEPITAIPQPPLITRDAIANP